MKGYWITQRITNSMNFGTKSTFAYLIYKMPEKYYKSPQKVLNPLQND